MTFLLCVAAVIVGLTPLTPELIILGRSVLQFRRDFPDAVMVRAIRTHRRIEA